MAVGSTCGGGCRKTGASRTHPVDSSGVSGQQMQATVALPTTGPWRPARTELSVPVLPNDIVWTLMGQVAFRPMPGIVLAAGRSLRMGRPKALLPWPATQVPLVLHVTETLRDAGIGPLGVVTGEHHDADCRNTCEHRRRACSTTPDIADGQLGSLLHGLRWAFAQTDGDWALATLVDVPRVQSSTVRDPGAGNRGRARASDSSGLRRPAWPPGGVEARRPGAARTRPIRHRAHGPSCGPWRHKAPCATCRSTMRVCSATSIHPRTTRR